MVNRSQAVRELKEIARAVLPEGRRYLLRIQCAGEKTIIRSTPDLPDLTPGVYDVDFLSVDETNEDEQLLFSESVQIEAPAEKEKPPPQNGDSALVRQLLEEIREMRTDFQSRLDAMHADRSGEKETFYTSMLAAADKQNTALAQMYRDNVQFIISTQKTVAQSLKDQIQHARTDGEGGSSVLEDAAAELIKEVGPDTVRMVLETMKKTGGQI